MPRRINGEGVKQRVRRRRRELRHLPQPPQVRCLEGVDSPSVLPALTVIACPRCPRSFFASVTPMTNARQLQRQDSLSIDSSLANQASTTRRAMVNLPLMIPSSQGNQVQGARHHRQAQQRHIRDTSS